MAEKALLLNVDHVAVELGPYPSIQQQDDQAATEELGTGEGEASAELSAKEELGDDPRLYRPLHRAALKGDWWSAKRFLIDHPQADITRPLNPKKMNILHVAANMGHTRFIRKLVESGCFPKEALQQKDDSGYTALHYSAAVGNLRAVKFLVSIDNKLTTVKSEPKIITGEEKGDIALCSAADNTAKRKVIQYLIKKITDVNNVPDIDDPFPGVEGADLITSLVAGGHYDTCLRMLERYPESLNAYNAWVEKNPTKIKNPQQHSSCDLLLTLVCRPTEFPSQSSLTFMERCIYHLTPVKEAPVSCESILGASDDPQHWSTRIRSQIGKVIQWIVGAASLCPVYYVPGIKRIRDKKYKHKCIIQLLHVACRSMLKWKVEDIVSYFEETKVCYEAAEHGATEIIRAFIEYFPDILDDVDVERQILVTAIQFRQEKIYNIMMERGITVKLLPAYVDEEKKETVLHIAAKLAPYHRLSSVSCPALQMQRELQWFKGVEKFVPPSMKVLENNSNQTPQELFTAQHKDLVREAEKWMKETSTACLVVATLIITVAFAAALTPPGGLDSEGIPTNLHRTSFALFFLSEIVGMFSSATSIFMFLSILTSRYAENDFLYALPKRLILGLVSMILAISSMMTAFGATLYLILAVHGKDTFSVNLMTAFSGIPIGLFIMLQLPLIIFMVRSTYGPSILKEKRIPCEVISVML